jgi:hypothetical protein
MATNHARWTAENDAKLWSMRQTSMSQLMAEFNREKGGIAARLKHLQNPDHAAYQRLFKDSRFQPSSSVSSQPRKYATASAGSGSDIFKDSSFQSEATKKRSFDSSSVSSSYTSASYTSYTSYESSASQPRKYATAYAGSPDSSGPKLTLPNYPQLVQSQPQSQSLSRSQNYPPSPPPVPNSSFPIYDQSQQQQQEEQSSSVSTGGLAKFAGAAGGAGGAGRAGRAGTGAVGGAGVGAVGAPNHARWTAENDAKLWSMRQVCVCVWVCVYVCL